jgi:hypothetical protein
LIQQNGIYIISRFKVTNAKTFYRPVAGELMIKFTCYTKIAPATNPPSTFPKYIYRLTPFDQIDSFVDGSEDFLGKKLLDTHILVLLFFTLCLSVNYYPYVNETTDVLGVIIDVSETRNVQFRVQAEPTVARDIVIKDLG